MVHAWYRCAEESRTRPFEFCDPNRLLAALCRPQLYLVEMSFVEPDFLGFFALVWCAYWTLHRSRRVQNALLLLTSVVFYAWVHWWMAALLLGSALLDYVAARAIAANREHGTRWVVASVVGNIGTLCAFKYGGWFADDISRVLAELGMMGHESTLSIFLPVGLSFYTFQTMAYTIDVWREQLEVRTDLLDYMVFVCFFPQLVAGPVERASNLLPQFETARSFDLEQVGDGVGLALRGAFKKIVIADTMAPYVNAIFVAPDPSWGMTAAATLGFTIQVLADFSGYTDMARGIARTLGIELMENFDHPYLATSPMDFWRRWHISFSTWLRDYVYMPASFSPWVRKWVTIPGTGRWNPFWHTARALFITMMLSGLWHGSTSNYLLWGLWYAVIGTVWVGAQKRIPRSFRRSRDWRPVLVPGMFCLTLIGMLIFREPDLARLFGHLGRSPFASTEAQTVVTLSMLSVCAAGALPLLALLAFDLWARPRLAERRALLPFRTTSWALVAVLLLTFQRPTTEDFVYFQF